MAPSCIASRSIARMSATCSGRAATSSQPMAPMRSALFPTSIARFTDGPQCGQAPEICLDARPVVWSRLRRRSVQPCVHVDQRLEVGGVGDRRVAEPVDADHLGGDALAHLRLVERIGEDHQARVRVQVDEPGSHDEPGRIDPPVGGDRPPRSRRGRPRGGRHARRPPRRSRVHRSRPRRSRSRSAGRTARPRHRW